MSESEQSGEVKQRVDAYLDERMQWMGDAVELFTGDRNDDPLEVFPSATEVRADGLAVVTIDGEARAITEEEEPKLREIAGRFGVGGQTDVLSHAQYQFIEGGKIWKVEAEVAIAAEAEVLVFGGMVDRIVGEDEAQHAQTKFGVDINGMSEYEMVRTLLGTYEDFEPTEEEVLPIGYEVAEGNPIKKELTGQLVKIGEKSGKSVLLFRVDQKNAPDKKPEFRPDGTRIMTLLSEYMNDVSIGIVTSNTYASRAIDVVRAGLQRKASFDVGMYGREKLAIAQGKVDAEGNPVTEQSELKQIPGEMNTIYGKLLKLQVELENVKD